MRLERSANLDSRIDTDTGEFEMVMATEGEASDGHIISMRGLELGDELPLQLDHGRSALSNLGTVTNMRLDKIDGIPVARGVGRIRLTGDGEALAARRDIVDAISRGDIRGVSMTWDSEKHSPRTDLPRSHSAHVPRGETSARKRHGLFFEESRAVEQSIVAIPADREALIGRADAVTDDLSRAVYQTMISRLDDGHTTREQEIIEALEERLAVFEQRQREAEAEALRDVSPPPAVDAVMAQLGNQLGTWRDRTASELDDALGEILLRVTGK